MIWLHSQNIAAKTWESHKPFVSFVFRIGQGFGKEPGVPPAWRADSTVGSALLGEPGELQLGLAGATRETWVRQASPVPWCGEQLKQCDEGHSPLPEPHSLCLQGSGHRCGGPSWCSVPGEVESRKRGVGDGPSAHRLDVRKKRESRTKSRPTATQESTRVGDDGRVGEQAW